MISEYLLPAVILTFDVIVTAFMLYLVARLLHWAKDKPLPGAHNRIFNIALVSLVTAVAMLLIVDVEMIVIFPAIKSGLLTLIEEIDLFATAVISFLTVFVFIMLRRISKPERASTRETASDRHS